MNRNHAICHDFYIRGDSAQEHGPFYELHFIGTIPEARNQGLGKHLMLPVLKLDGRLLAWTLLSSCQKQGMARMPLWCLWIGLARWYILQLSTTTATAEDTARIFRHDVFRLHGVPMQLVTDRDSKFTAAFWKEVCRLLGIEQAMSTAFHPQTDGQTERVNRILETC